LSEANTVWVVIACMAGLVSFVKVFGDEDAAQEQYDAWLMEYRGGLAPQFQHENDVYLFEERVA